MSSTKIINVLKDDSFQEILNLFKATPAEEVIFVLPKRSKAFQKEDHFLALKAEAKSNGKSVSFLCSNPELNEIAKKHHFDVLLARSPVARKKPAASKVIVSPEAKELAAGSIDVVNQIEDFYSEPAHDSSSISTAVADDDEEIDEEEVVPVTTASRKLSDVVVPQDEEAQSVKVAGKAEKAQPVQVHQKEEAEEEEPAAEPATVVWGSLKSSQKPIQPKLTVRKSQLPRGTIALATGALIVLGAVFFVTTGKAQVTIKPNSQPLDARINVFASDNIPAIDPVAMSIPGQVFNIQKTESQDFPATGHVDVAQKARGTITVYNELSASQPLVATTRLESTDHHIFHTMTSIVVPPAKTVNGKLVPGNVDVQVIADKAGADYNVPVGLFTVPAFQEKGDTEKFQKVYGQSTAAMHDGANGQSNVATSADQTAAQQALVAKLTSDIQDELKSQVDGLKIINSAQINVGQPNNSSPAGAQTTFNSSLSGSLKTVGFKESDLDSLIKQYVDTHNNLTVLPDKLTLDYENVHWDDAKNGLSFTVHVTGPAYAKIDQQQIITSLLGKNDTQIKAYLGGISGIQEAKVSLSPFWVRSVPKNQAKVKVDLSY